MIVSILNALERLRRYKTQWVEDLPDDPERNTIYIIGGKQYPFYAAVVCPRKKCKEVVHLDVHDESGKRWRITEHEDKTITLHPSIYVTGLPCKCHYWIRQGRVVWHKLPTVLVPEENRR